MSILRHAFLLAVLAAPVAARADAGDQGAALAFTLSDAVLSRRPLLVGDFDAEASARAAQSYFNYDALLTLGAMALAGGALAASARGARSRPAKVFPLHAPAAKTARPFAIPRDAA